MSEDDDDAAGLAQHRRRELGAFMRARRALVAPADVGLPERRRRHVPGLRREEVAQLAGIGLGWYTLLEQGRVEKISTAPLRRVMRTLRLSPTETDHALALARETDGRPRRRDVPAHELLAFVRAFGDGAAFVSDRSSGVVGWNALAGELFAFSEVRESERNMLALMVRSERVRRVFVDPSETLARMIGVFRATYAECADPHLDGLVAGLRAESAEFDAFWRTYTVDALTAHICMLRDERLGEVAMQFMAFTPVDHPDYTIVTLRPRPSGGRSAKPRQARANRI